MAVLNFAQVLQNSSLTAAQKTRFLDGFCAHHGYTDTIIDEAMQTVPNPETKAQFFSRVVTGIVRAGVQAYEATSAADQARQAKYDEINAIL